MSTLVVPAEEVIQSETAVDSSASPVSTNLCIGSRVRIRRTSRGMTQQELGELLNIDRSELDAYEAGGQRISANLLLRIAKLLGVQPDYFFRDYGGEDWKTA